MPEGSSKIVRSIQFGDDTRLLNVFASWRIWGLVQMSRQNVATAVPKICEAKELTVCSKDNYNLIAATLPSPGPIVS